MPHLGSCALRQCTEPKSFAKRLQARARYPEDHALHNPIAKIHIRPSTSRFPLRSSGSRFSYSSLAGAPFVAHQASAAFDERFSTASLSINKIPPPVTSCCLTLTHPSLTGHPFVARLASERLPTALLLGSKSSASHLLSSLFHLPIYPYDPIHTLPPFGCKSRLVICAEALHSLLHLSTSLATASVCQERLAGRR